MSHAMPGPRGYCTPAGSGMQVRGSPTGMTGQRMPKQRGATAALESRCTCGAAEHAGMEKAAGCDAGRRHAAQVQMGHTHGHSQVRNEVDLSQRK